MIVDFCVCLQPVINVFPVPDAAGLMCVTLGQLEIREVRWIQRTQSDFLIVFEHFWLNYYLNIFSPNVLSNYALWKPAVEVFRASVFQKLNVTVCMLSMWTGRSRAPASCKCCSVRGWSRLSWACPSPESLPPRTQRLVPHCRCLRCRTAGGTTEPVLYLFCLSYFHIAQISQCLISLSVSTLSSQRLVSPGVCVGALASVNGLPDALIGIDEGGCLFIW